MLPYLQSRGHDIVAVCSHGRPIEHSVRLFRYPEPSTLEAPTFPGQELWYSALLRAKQIALICSKLQSEGWKPDRVLAHSGWGESISIKQVWPDVPHIIWPELWCLPIHGGYGVDPSLPPPNLTHHLEQLGRNSLTRVALDQASAWILPTRHQADSFPLEFQSTNLHVIHEGINTCLACPNHDVNLTLRGITLNRSVPVVTFVNRNLERLRGFDSFMRSIPLIQQAHPTTQFIVVGDNERGYGNPHPSGRPLKDIMLEELDGKIDSSYVHFLGRIPYAQLISILQVSRVHVYLSFPFILGWSLLEAMSIGCSIVASHGPPVSEVITDGVDGLLVPINSPDRIAQRVSTLLSLPHLRSSLSRQARVTARAYDLSFTLPQTTCVIENLHSL
ncbi:MULTISPECIES: glycosyltransferase [unclassified Synechococcus]|uniref:glycosyltransferase n=1 Tax=unclassified Synechococcus TaxID=2626047 RepID=UPI001CF82DC3|nr:MULTISPECIES: glycosyltransferase [unclassified Synechococcus]